MEYNFRQLGYVYWGNLKCSFRSINPFFIGLYKDRKKKIYNHRSQVIEIFNKWNNNVAIDPLNILEPYPNSDFTIYMSISSQIEKIDFQGYGLSHLKDSSYSKVLSLYTENKTRELDYNKRVSEYFGKLYSIIWDIVVTDSRINDVSITHQLLINREKLDKEEKEKINEMIDDGALDSSIGLYTLYMIQYLRNRSNDHESIEEDFLIKDESSPRGWYFHKLISKRYLTKDKVIAKETPFGRTRLESLKKILLSDEFIEISKTLKEFDNEVKEIQRLYSEFTFEISKIVHDFSSLGLKGKCSVEKQLSFFSRR